MKKYWEPDGDRPGLKRVKSRLPASSGEELLSIVHAVQEAQTRLLLIVDPAVADLGERARFVVDELESALEFLLDDDVRLIAEARKLAEYLQRRALEAAPEAGASGAATTVRNQPTRHRPALGHRHPGRLAVRAETALRGASAPIHHCRSQSSETTLDV